MNCPACSAMVAPVETRCPKCGANLQFQLEEQWYLCGMLAYQTNQYIEQFLEKRDNGELPAKFCAEYLDPRQVAQEQQTLRRVMQRCMGECRLLQKMNCRETCEMWHPLVELYKKWHEVANSNGILVQK